MNWKEYKKIEKEISKEIRKEFVTYRKHLLEELNELEIGVTMSAYLRLQREVPIEERKKIIEKKYAVSTNSEEKKE